MVAYLRGQEATVKALRREESDLNVISRASVERRTEREERVRRAFYRGEALGLHNTEYVQALKRLSDELLREDSERGDSTVEAMGIGDVECGFEVRAKEAGVAAGLCEVQWLYKQAGLDVSDISEDGGQVAADDVLLHVKGRARELFRLERVIVNLIQRMSGIATATREMVDEIKMQSNAHVIATRKTPWGLLDKRAVHVGGGGTHRLNLGDAILIKTNHLRLAHEAGSSEAGAIQRAWSNRKSAAFVEVEVTNIEEAMIAARTLRDLQDADSCPCVLMLDNFSPHETEAAVKSLREHDLYDGVLVESSGNIGRGSSAAYADAGVDAISVGALTHSVRALDVSAKLISGTW